MDWSEAEGCIRTLKNGSEVATLECIPAVFNNVIEALLLFSGLVALFLLIFAGFRLITSGDDPKKLEEATHTATYAVAGLLLVLFSFLIINLVVYITGASCSLEFFKFGKGENCP